MRAETEGASSGVSLIVGAYGALMAMNDTRLVCPSAALRNEAHGCARLQLYRGRVRQLNLHCGDHGLFEDCSVVRHGCLPLASRAKNVGEDEPREERLRGETEHDVGGFAGDVVAPATDLAVLQGHVQRE